MTRLVGRTGLFLVAFVASGAANARPMTSAMHCADVQRLIARSGAAVINFTPTTYDRVVRDQRFCLPSEMTQIIYVPTRDTPNCFAGYTCREGDSWDRW